MKLPEAPRIPEEADPLIGLMDELLSRLGYDLDPEAGATASRFVRLLEDFRPTTAVPELSRCVLQSTDPVVVRDLPFHSLCVHHLLPFFGTADLVHLPVGPVAGLGSFPRVLRHFATQPQLQERLGGAVAEHLQSTLGGTVAIRLRARHLCLEMRGERVSATLETRVVRGPDADAARTLLG